LREVRSLVRATVTAEDYLGAPGEFIGATTLRPGVRIGSWRILRQLGQGGMGTVYLAERANVRASISAQLSNSFVAESLTRTC
jgi:serine/threonine protein kinase